MSKLQNLNAQIEKAQAEIQQKENRVKELVSKQKAEEKKARNHRLCKRHGLLEKFMPSLITITDEQFETFIKKGIDTSYGRNILAEIAAQGAETISIKTTASTAQPTGTANDGTSPTATQIKSADHNTIPSNSKPTSATPHTNTNPTSKSTSTNHNANNPTNGNSGGGTTDRGN